jgi:inhibitor of KinA sporulation pathway (predicted exonuclease)
MKIVGKINVIDIEATCWNNGGERKDQPNETIEIGIAEVDLSDLTMYRNEGFYIIPQNSTISDFCTKLTGITPEVIKKQGESFAKAIRLLKTTFRVHQRHWISWGDYDKNQLRHDCDRHNLQYHRIFFKRHVNFKTVFAMMHGLPRELGVEAALSHVKLSFIGSPHSGKDDAHNIARLYIHTLKKFRTKK